MSLVYMRIFLYVEQNIFKDVALGCWTNDESRTDYAN